MLIEQGFLNDEYGADGKFGKNTKEAVKAYQASKGLKVDGIVGEDTLDALKGRSTASTFSDIDVSAKKNGLKEQEEEIRNKKRTPSTLDNVSSFVTGNIAEYITNPAKELISKVTPEVLGVDYSLKTGSRHDNTEGVLPYLLDSMSIADIRKQKNVSFLQISENKGGNTIIPERLKERVVNATYPQGYSPDVDISKSGVDRFGFVERIMSEDAKSKQVKRLPGKKGDNREDIYRMYSGLPQKFDTFTASSFKAGPNSDTNVTFKDPDDVLSYLYMAASKTNLFDKLAKGEITPEIISSENKSDRKGGDKEHKAAFRDSNNVMWNAQFGIGFDGEGQPYLSFYDNWDLKGKDDYAGVDQAFGSPIEIYDRIPLTPALIKKLARVTGRKDKSNASDSKPGQSKEEVEKGVFKLEDQDLEFKKLIATLRKEIASRYK